jgi:DNA-binding transcriptional ArsR family regulator
MRIKMTPQKKAKIIEDAGCLVRMVHLDRVKKAREADPPLKETMAAARIFKTLGDPNRLRLVMALLEGEMCVCDLSAFLGISESAASHQLRRLKDLALVKSRRDGQVLYYSLDDEHVALLIDVCLEHVRH